MDRSKFYASLRARGSGVFGTSLSQGQVNGLESLLDEAINRAVPLRRLAYALGTTYLETAHTMQPIHEIGPRSYFNKYEPGTTIGKRLGNVLKGDGYRYRGRGYVQITGRRNYGVASNKIKVDFVSNPERVLEPKLAAAIMFSGMDEGWFTGKDFSDFIDEFDESEAEELREFIEARRIINGTDKAKQIAGYAKAFENALEAAGYAVKGAAPAPAKPLPAPVPPTPAGIPSDGPLSSDAPPVDYLETVLVKPAPQRTGLWALLAILASAIASYFGVK